MDYLESEMQTMMRQMAREFAAQEVRPASIEYDRKPEPSECFPWDLLEKASALGLRTVAVPEAYGGEGMDEIFGELEPGKLRILETTLLDAFIQHLKELYPSKGGEGP